MKKLLFTVLFALPFTALCQNESSYKEVMAKMMRYYNDGQLDSLNSLLAYEIHKWRSKDLDDLRKVIGQVRSHKFMLIDSTELDVHSHPMAYFKACHTKQYWGKKVNAMAISLDSNNKICGMAFMTKSEHTDSLLAKF